LTETPFGATIPEVGHIIGLASFTVPIHAIGAVFFCAGAIPSDQPRI
jgi:hypothetical protein